MALVVNTNIASLNAQRSLSNSQSMAATSLERLSSGLRINSASDDAAGLAISSRLQAQVEGLNQAARNANDGVSLLQTAEAALQEVTNNLLRVRELAVQASNATLSTADRTAINTEVTQLVAEMERVASNTSFVGTNLLDGTFSSKTFQVGANNGETVSISSIASAKTTALGQSYSASDTGSAVNTTASSGSNVSINGVNIAASVDDGSGSANADASAKAKAAAINRTSGLSGVTATANATQELTVGTSTDSGNTDATAQITINGTDVGTVTDAGTAAANVTALVAVVNDDSATTGITAAANSAGDGLVLTAADGRNISITATVTQGAAATEDTNDFGLGALTTGTIATTLSTITLTSESSITIGGTAAVLGNSSATASLTGTAISNISLATSSGAETAITSVDAALNSINESRASLGAYQNRFESIVKSAQVAAENADASRSRIQDADFATETASLAKSQILQQAGISVLSQANAMPQQVLALLQ